MTDKNNIWLPVAAKLLNEHDFKTMRDTEEIYVYKDGVYVKEGESVIKSSATLYLAGNFSTHYIREILGRIKYSTFVNRDEFNKDRNIINLKNGLLNLETLELKPHTPTFLSTIRIPLTYDPEARCPSIEKFLSEIMSEVDIKKIIELSGYALVPTHHIQKAFLYVGGGRNGKSTLIELQRRFVGMKNCASISLQELQMNRFASSHLYGKLLNAQPDLSGKKMTGADVFKTLTGGDTITAEKKFKHPFEFKNIAKLIFATNTIPQVDDDSDAFYRRWEMINFPNKFEEKEDVASGVKIANKKLIDELTKEEELSGFLNLALKGLHRLEKQGYFSHQKSIDEIADEYKMASDSVYAFIKVMCVVRAKGLTVKAELYKSYVEYCKDEKVPPVSEKAFSESLKKYGSIIESRPLIDGVRKYCWNGIELKP